MGIGKGIVVDKIAWELKLPDDLCRMGIRMEKFHFFASRMFFEKARFVR
jgi:hypothetical protein